MGAVKPPWISEKEFKKATFNYCDHFGDEDKLAKICKICKEGKEARENALASEDISPDATDFPLYNIAFRYSNLVSSLLGKLETLPLEANTKLATLTVESLAHSCPYVLAKLNRALRGRWDAENNNNEFSGEDSKTSALLAFVAVRRNEVALKALSLHEPLAYLRRDTMGLALFSADLALMIHEELIETEILAFHEMGCDSFNNFFSSFKNLNEHFFQEVVGINKRGGPQKQILIKVEADAALEKIIGGKEMKMSISEGMTFLMLLNTIFQFHPEIEKKYPPGKLGILLNHKPPTTPEPLKDGDVVELSAV